MARRPDLHLSPTSDFRPEVEVLGALTRVLTEHTAAVDPGRLGGAAGSLTYDELRQVDAALRLVLALWVSQNHGHARRGDHAPLSAGVRHR